MTARPLRAVFIEPKPPNQHIFSLYALPRLGSVLLATLLKEAGWDVTVYVEEVGSLDFDQILRADLVGISTITSTAPRAYAIADEVRRSGIPVVLGGPHVTSLPEEGLEHADMVVRGEGELPILALAQYVAGGGHLGSVPGLSYRIGNSVVHNPLPQPVDLEELPVPDLSLIHGYEDNGSRVGSVIPIQTARGCPFDCNFCSVTAMFGRRLRRRKVKSIVAELERYRERKPLVFFYDDNFTANPEHAREICQSILDEGLDMEWSAQVRLEIADDPELLELMHRAGCRTLFIGFESVNPLALAEGGKSQPVDQMADAVKTIRKARIDVHGMFIFGFDADGDREMKATTRFARKVPITTVQFLILTPFPGTELYERFHRERRIFSSDWNLYDGHHVVFTPDSLQPLKLQRSQLKAHDRFYSWFRSFKKLAKLRFAMAGIYIYARRNNATWKLRNRLYMKGLKSILTDHTQTPFPPVQFPDVRQAARSARRSP